MHKKKYQKYALLRKNITCKEFNAKSKTIFIIGVKIAIGASSKWGHLFGNSLLVGTIDDEELGLLNPSFIWLLLLGLAQDVIGQLLGAVLSGYNAQGNAELNEQERITLANKISTTVTRLLTITTLCYAVLIIFLCIFGIEPMIYFFFNPLGPGKKDNATITYNISATSRRVLQENQASLIPSNIQISSAGVLYGWGMLLTPNLITLGTTMLGLAGGYHHST